MAQTTEVVNFTIHFHKTLKIYLIRALELRLNDTLIYFFQGLLNILTFRIFLMTGISLEMQLHIFTDLSINNF